MASEIIMPKNGMTLTEGTVVRWLKGIGEAVASDEPILEIETGKSAMEVESPASGVLLARYAEEGDVVPVLAVIGYVGQAGEGVPASMPALRGGGAEPKAAARTAVNEGYDYDIAIIGGGPAGYVGAIRAAQSGARVVLFEKGDLGGTCLNRGCIPTKSYLKSAGIMADIRKAERFGIEFDGTAHANLGKIHDRKEGVVRTLRDGVGKLLDRRGVKVVDARAELAGDREVAAGGAGYSAAKIILCTGSKAVLPPIPGMGHAGVLTSDSILGLRELPRHLCVIGGGVIGCELGYAFRAFGSEVTILEAEERILPGFDGSVSEAIRGALAEMGITVMTGAKVRGVGDDGGRPVVAVEGNAFPCDKVLVSVGRAPVLDCLGPMRDRFQMERGYIKVDGHMETGVKGIYAAGDVSGRLMLAHAASMMAEAAVMSALGDERVCDLRYAPSCLYTVPEAAGVGMTERQARERHGDDVSVGHFPMAANGRAVASGDGGGFVRVIVGRRYGEILGTHIVGASAVEMIAGPAALMASEVTAHEVAESLPHAHPTYGEAFAEACADALGRCVHLP